MFTSTLIYTLYFVFINRLRFIRAQRNKIKHRNSLKTSNNNIIDFANGLKKLKKLKKQSL